MIFQKLVMSKAAIKNGRIVITNDMITRELDTGGIHLNSVRVRETSFVDVCMWYVYMTTLI